jgi:hypothetical protein
MLIVSIPFQQGSKRDAGAIEATVCHVFYPTSKLAVQIKLYRVNVY